MANIHIKIDEETKKEFQLRVIQKGLNISRVVRTLIKKWLGEKK